MSHKEPLYWAAGPEHARSAKRMRASGINAYGKPETLVPLEMPLPNATEHDVYIRVKAAGVGIWDAKMRAGEFGKHEMPLVLGVEVAGVVDRVGAKVERFHAGDDVFVYLSKPGGYAEFVAEHEQFVSHMPLTLNYVRAAALPVAGITADTAIADGLNLTDADKIVIAGAAGGVGTIAVQMAKAAGAYVIGTGSAENEEYVRSLGADEYVDYTKGDAAAQIRARYPDGVDCAIDAVGGPNVENTVRSVKPSGKIVELTGHDPKGNPSIEVIHFGAKPSGSRLDKVASLVDSGKVKVEIARTFPLAQAKEAHELVEQRHVRGKLVLTI
ncbi:MAG: NADP-dependent oxidoreductase [Candidatus Eremiobacteraeota bacterium]|nr:NADP-dependent oxidoreductase [Candidatus Eremiobacteraeota bacterium]MBV8354287.1 NADP-dependent oxidoreductase [Candidatus Eremiobacteraeota bacterium]MBV8531483.1 NADP-dependent oxidoreductase [Candidatus Eremiobacteraeota bacterium]